MPKLCQPAQSALPAAEIARLHHALQTLIGGNCQIDIQIVPHLVPLPNGKHRPVFSLLNPGDATLSTVSCHR